MKRINTKVGIFTVLFLLFLMGQSVQAQHSIPKCQARDHSQFNKCFTKLLDDIYDYAKFVKRDQNLFSLEEVKVGKIPVNLNLEGLVVKGEFTNNVARGFLNAEHLAAKSDIDKLRMDVKVNLPKLEIHGNYVLNGQIPLIPVRAAGTYIMNAFNSNAIYRLKFRRVQKNGKTHWQVVKSDVDFALKSLKFRIIEKQSQVLEQVYSTIINENSDYYAELFKPTLSRIVTSELRKYLNSVFAAIPENEYFVN